MGERVPFEEYVLPARPPTLAPLLESGDQPGAVVLRPDAAGPNHPVTATFRWEAAGLPRCRPGGEGFPNRADDYYLALAANTPGLIRVLLDGVEVSHDWWWDYESSGTGWNVAYQSWQGACLEISRGDLVTVTVEPEHMSGDWLVVIYQHT